MTRLLPTVISPLRSANLEHRRKGPRGLPGPLPTSPVASRRLRTLWRPEGPYLGGGSGSRRARTREQSCERALVPGPAESPQDAPGPAPGPRGRRASAASITPQNTGGPRLVGCGPDGLKCVPPQGPRPTAIFARPAGLWPRPRGHGSAGQPRPRRVREGGQDRAGRICARDLLQKHGAPLGLVRRTCLGASRPPARAQEGRAQRQPNLASASGPGRTCEIRKQLEAPDYAALPASSLPGQGPREGGRAGGSLRAPSGPVSSHLPASYPVTASGCHLQPAGSGRPSSGTRAWCGGLGAASRPGVSLGVGLALV